VVVPGFEHGSYVGPTMFDHVKPGMTVGDDEIFGPVVCIKRVKNFEEGLAIMNANQFANGSVIYTQSGYYAREFAKRTHGGHGWRQRRHPRARSESSPSRATRIPSSGIMHAMGTDGVRFFTELKSVTTHWFSEEEAREAKVVNSWDGTISFPDKK
jgi:malonate-semialdehyde dehydrogenase (acetylating)/methylmalonate-semialdehyde dehydrogenase